MRATKKEIKQNSLIHSKIRDAAFVTTEIPDTKKFKYNISLSLNKYISNSLRTIVNVCKKPFSRSRLLTKDVDFHAIKNDTSIWLIEAFIEGAAINFVVWTLLGFDFNMLTTLAWGIGVKQVISFYWRLKKDGSNTKISAENQ